MQIMSLLYGPYLLFRRKSKGDIQKGTDCRDVCSRLAPDDACMNLYDEFCHMSEDKETVKNCTDMSLKGTCQKIIITCRQFQKTFRHL